ncbi:MAG: hypothetical protein ACRDTG_05695 [Pseudonocardiaceae bacterium]
MCAEKIRLRSLLQAGEPIETPIALLYHVVRKIHLCCGHTLFKSHRLACGWTLEKAVSSFHTMCDTREIKRRGLTTRSWLEWEAGGVPNRDYQDLLCRLFTTGPVQLGFSIDYTPASLMPPLGDDVLADGAAASKIEQCDIHMQTSPKKKVESPDSAHSLAEDQDLTGIHTTLDSNPDVVHRILDEAFCTLTDESIFLCIEKIERVLLGLCKRMLLTSLGCDNHEGRVYVLENIVHIKGCALILKVRPDLQFDQLLRVILQDPNLPHFDSPGDYSHTEMWLNDSVGHYQGVCVTLPTHLGSGMCDQIAQQVADGFTAGYLWLKERIRRSLAHLGGTLEHDSLQLVRRQLLVHGCANLAQQLWLVKVADGRVTYAVDGDVSTRVLHAGREFRGLQQAPASIACALLANSIPLDRSFSLRAIGENRTVDMSLRSTPYSDINEDFLVAQTAIYADRMLLTPLVGDRRGWLLAAYPSVIRTELAGVLGATQTDLEEYFNSKPTRMLSPAIRHSTRRLLSEEGIP